MGINAVDMGEVKQKIEKHVNVAINDLKFVWLEKRLKKIEAKIEKLESRR